MYDYIVLFQYKAGPTRIVLKTNSLKDAQAFCKASDLKGDLTIYKARETYQN